MTQQNKQLKTLQKEWYTKLKKSGFEDIEQDENNLKEWESSRYYRGRNNEADFEKVILIQEAKEQYYRMAGHFLHDHNFESAVDKFIWEMHSEGVAHRKIVPLLKKFKLKRERHWVRRVIDRLKAQMMVRYKDHDGE